MLRVVAREGGSSSLAVRGEDELLPLAEAATRGEVAALRTLLTTLAPSMLRVVRRILGTHNSEVEDVAQECALELVTALRRFRGESSVQHFACRVALRASMNARRRQRAAKRAHPEGLHTDADETAGHSAPQDAHLASRAGAELARELCDQLPAPQAEAFALHCVLGYTMTEVAAISGAPLETVRSRLRTAKAALVQKALADPRLRELVEEIA